MQISTASQSVNAPPAPDEVNLAATWRIISRRKLQIAAVTLFLTALAGGLIYRLTPIYSSVAVVLVGTHKPVLMGRNDSTTGDIISTDIIESEVQVLSSTKLAWQVIQKLGLDRDPEFNPTLSTGKQTKPLKRQVKDALKAAMDYIGIRSSWTEDESPMSQVLKTFLDDLTILPIAKSHAIRIGFESISPLTAAAVVNTLAESYRERQVAGKVDANTHFEAWLHQHLTGLRDQAKKSAQEVEKYRDSKGLLRGKEGSLVAEQISGLNVLLVEAQARLSQAEAKRAEVRKALALPGAASATAEVLQSELIQKLQQQRAQLSANMAELSTRFRPESEPLVSSKAQYDSLTRTLAAETGKIIRQLDAQVSRSTVEVEHIKAQLAELEDQARQENVASAELATLEWEARADDAIYQNLLSRFKETEIRESSPEPDSEIISPGEVPTYAFFPKPALMISLSAFTAAIIATSIALTLERSRATVGSTRQVETLLGSEVLGLIPAMKGYTTISDAPQICADQLPISLFGRAIRNLHVNLTVGGGAAPKTILVASALSGEGKSSTAVALALLLTSTGRRTIIIDCDLRRPQLHKAFACATDAGLADYLCGRAEIMNIINCNTQWGVHVIAAGGEVAHPGDLLGSVRMKALLAALGDAYDTIILDSPPIAAVSDTLVLAPQVDATIFLMRWRKTPQNIAARSLRHLAAAGANISGVVLTIVNFAQLERDGIDEYYRSETVHL
jgi:capsular exopolysaccharide synthesis family protein